MWTDRETTDDYLNFTGIVDVVTSTIQSEEDSLTIGISGDWGVGKTSMLRMIEKTLSKDNEEDYIFIEFNAWLYQGFDDARTAIIDIVAKELSKHKNVKDTLKDQALSIISRIQWSKLLKAGITHGVPLAMGIPPVGMLSALKNAITGENQEDISKAIDDISQILEDKPETSGSILIHEVRKEFETLIEKLGKRIVVLVDDLDRCLPETTISTLEAIRLFLSMKGCVFIIAADEQILKSAMKKHFHVESNTSQVTSYFDKLIQLPVRVPAAGVTEMRAYLALLTIENSNLSDDIKESIRNSVIQRLSKSYTGVGVDPAFIMSLGHSLPADTKKELERINESAKLFALGNSTKGNPRLVKRFLNTMAVREKIAQKQDIQIDRSVLFKILLLEREASPKVVSEFRISVESESDGRSSILQEQSNSGEISKSKYPECSQSDFFNEWVNIHPPLVDIDLRPALYLSRDVAPLSLREITLSEPAVELLKILQGGIASTQDRRIMGELMTLSHSDKLEIISQLLNLGNRDSKWESMDFRNSVILTVNSTENSAFLVEEAMMQLPKEKIKAALINSLRQISQLDIAKLVIHWRALKVPEGFLNA